MDRRLPGVPVVRVGSSLHLAASFFPTPGGRRGSARSPPALMADVRIVIRRNFPVGPMGPIVERVDVDIALRRQQSRKLRCPERVERALAEHVVPFVKHSFDRRAVAIASKDICRYVSEACADPRLADGGVQVLILLDTFACPTLLRPAPRPRNGEHYSTGSPEFGVAVRTCPCMETGRFMKIGVKSKEQQRAIGTIGDGLPAKAGGVDRLEGWVPW
ncbi:hypothetical protein GUJ93_ZPchr0001g30486 [Zizania palustris]|uniref:Uncharacterized protein n=1 Tax=Zizania palustris TaxID=103762 RepID=A0A8J5V9J7_ZIZPA|nr:hypothetical protein GUJ93_ZPchr0001g30486 [Zizania palustris]